MIDLETIREIIATYTKHGWLLRRVLLTTGSKPVATDSLSNAFGDAEIRESLLNAAWFSRPPQAGGVAWELRYLGSTPFALVEHADENSPDFEEVLADVEERLRLAIAGKHAA